MTHDSRKEKKKLLKKLLKKFLKEAVRIATAPEGQPVPGKVKIDGAMFSKETGTRAFTHGTRTIGWISPIELNDKPVDDDDCQGSLVPA